MKQIENTLQDLKCMLIEDGYTEANIVMRTLIKAQEQVQNCSIPDVVCSSCSAENSKRWDRYEIGLNDKDGTSVDVSVDYCENCGHVHNMGEY